MKYDMFKSKVIFQVKGNNLERFIHRLVKKKIELLDVKNIKYNEAIITIYKYDYDKVVKLKTIYEVSKISERGFSNLKHKVLKNLVLIFSVFICLIILKVLTSMTFSIKIVHNDKEIRDIISNELKSYGIKKYSIKKNYDEIRIIKENILNKYKDKIEWLEIEIVGVNYLVRVQERSIISKPEIGEKRNVVSKKNAIIKSIKASSGVIVKNINDYVVPGDVIISGEVKLNDELKSTVDASGIVYGEVWYETTVEYPFVYREERETGDTKKVYSIKFLNNYINLFDFNKYDTSIKKEKKLFSNNILPIHLIELTERKTVVIDQVLTEELAISKAKELAVKKIESNLKDSEYIIKKNLLNVSVKEDKVIIDMFFSVYENITDYRILQVE